MSDITIKSKGLKRKIATLAITTAAAARAVPGGELLAQPLDMVAGAFGGAGVIHAAGAGTLDKVKIAGLASTLSFGIFLSQLGLYDLGSLTGPLTQITSLLGAVSVGSILGSLKK